MGSSANLFAGAGPPPGGLFLLTNHPETNMKSLKILSRAPSTRRTDLDRWQSLIRHESGTPRL